MKNAFVAPEVELIRLEAIDVITASGTELTPGEDELPWV